MKLLRYQLKYDKVAPTRSQGHSQGHKVTVKVTRSQSGSPSGWRSWEDHAYIFLHEAVCCSPELKEDWKSFMVTLHTSNVAERVRGDLQRVSSSSQSDHWEWPHLRVTSSVSDLISEWYTEWPHRWVTSSQNDTQSDLIGEWPHQSEWTKTNSQLPNLRGQACPSMGKFMSRMGHSALMVSLQRRVQRKGQRRGQRRVQRRGQRRVQRRGQRKRQRRGQRKCQRGDLQEWSSYVIQCCRSVLPCSNMADWENMKL